MGAVGATFCTIRPTCPLIALGGCCYLHFIRPSCSQHLARPALRAAVGKRGGWFGDRHAEWPTTDMPSSAVPATDSQDIHRLPSAVEVPEAERAHPLGSQTGSELAALPSDAATCDVYGIQDGSGLFERVRSIPTAVHHHPLESCLAVGSSRPTG